ncbi:hypothetical protein QQ045_006273 [Rhodiola kirilowii]
MPLRKKLRPHGSQPDTSSSPHPDLLADLPDDVLMLILTRLSASASSPLDLLSVSVTCKRMNKLSMSPAVLRELSGESMAVKASHWSESFHRFLRRSVKSGNLEAHYRLGMIQFYCLGHHASGSSLMAKAAMMNHAPSLFSLAVIHFNASGKSKDKKDLEAGVALCVRAAYLGSIDALRELGHCVIDGYGIRRDFHHGRRLILQASLHELQVLKLSGSVESLHQPDATHRFLREWFEANRCGVSGLKLKLCSNEMCGRVETRANEFRRCSVCSAANYCSRSCQALHWRSRHKDVCAPNGIAFDEAEGGGGPNHGINVDFDGVMNVGFI